MFHKGHTKGVEESFSLEQLFTFRLKIEHSWDWQKLSILKVFIGALIPNALVLWVVLTTCLINVQPAYAHSPHDVVSHVEVSQNFGENQTLFVVVRGNLLKSEDGGSTWERPFKGLDNQNNLSGLTAAANSIMFASSTGDGIYKSEDAGDSWHKINTGLVSLNIDQLCSLREFSSSALARDTDKNLYIADEGGEAWSRTLQANKIDAIECSESGNKLFAIDEAGAFFASEDNGLSWTQGFEFRDFGKVVSIEATANGDSDLVFVGTEDGKLFKSIDDGLSFAEVGEDAIDDSIQDIETIVDDQANLTLFISTWHGGLYRSDDEGESWEKYSTGLTKTGQADKDKEPHFTDLNITESFQDDQTIFLAGFDGLFKTTDAGNSWQQLDTLSSRAITSLSISPSYPEDSTITVGTYKNEAYISSDSGDSWTPINSGLTKVLFNRYGDRTLEVHRARFYDLIFSPNYRSDQTLFAMLNYYYFRSEDSGRTWDEIIVKGKEDYSTRGRFIVVSPDFANDQTVYIVTRYGGLVSQSTDGGKTFSAVGSIDEKLNSFVISPNYGNDETLYASSATGIYKTADAGKTWTLMTAGDALESELWLAISMSPDYETDKTIFAGTDHGIFKTQDDGETWEALKSSTLGEESVVEIIALSPNYTADKTLIIGIQGKGIFRSTDAGVTFQQVGNDLQEKNVPLLPFDTVPTSSTSIQFSPSYKDDQTVFAFGSATAEVFKSIDGGSTWQIIEIEEQPNRPDDMVKTGLLVTEKSLTYYPYSRFIPALIVAIGTYFAVAKVLKISSSTKRRRLQLFSAVSGFVLTVGLLTILF
ncbi:MAG: hypothetical protein F6J95_022695 [Leptolyngbya sp. SIO1E4]|nr:hypothetical protein [Leptolyngbya sp. SIO1E4]